MATSSMLSADTATPLPATAGDVRIPILDLGPYFAGEPGALERAAAELRYIGENVGFHYIRNHGVPQSLIDQTFEQARRFHAQPLEAKQKVKINEHMQGYMGMRASTTRSSDLTKDNKPNQNEAYFVQREISPSDPEFGKPRRAANQWPEDLPGFKQAVLAYYDTLERLARRMLPIYAVALGLPPAYFDGAFRKPMASLRMTHYPPVDYVENEYGIAPHTDSSFFTLLAQNRLAGLQIKARDGTWIDAPAIDGTIVVNSGDILRRWTNDRFLSTPHRANNVDRIARYAIPFFVHPDPDFVMECLPTCRGPDNPPRYPAQTSAEYMAWFGGRNYDHIRQQRNITD